MENKLSNIWKCFLPSVCIFVLQMAISFVGMFFVFCYKAHTYTSGSFSDFFQGYYNAVTSTDFNVGVMLVYAAIAAVLFFFWYYKESCDKSAKKGAFALLKANPATCIVGVILLSFGMQYLCTYLMNVVSVLFPNWLTQYETLMDGMGLSESLTLPLVLYTVVIGPICEELTFRGLTFSLCQTCYAVLGSQCGTGTAFCRYAYESAAGSIYLFIWLSAWIFCGKGRQSFHGASACI